jgi:hypothetical protein
MGWSTRKGAGPDEKRAQLAQQRQHDRDASKLKRGDAKAERINDRLNDRRIEAKRQGR